MSSSNIHEVVTWLENFVDGFNFELPGVDQSMGRDLAHIVAGRISERGTQDSRGKDPARWKELSDNPGGKGYKTRKRKAYGWTEPDGKPNVRTTQMLSEKSCFGNTVVTAKLVEIHYGIDAPPSRCDSPTDNRTPSQKKADAAVTDRQKAGWAHKKGRPFFELDDDIEAAVVKEAETFLVKYVLSA